MSRPRRSWVSSYKATRSRSLLYNYGFVSSEDATKRVPCYRTLGHHSVGPSFTLARAWSQDATSLAVPRRGLAVECKI